ncbi:MAG: LysR family transcriptional regulator [Burkholderiales bacterium]|nr:MAG: LysR family transcriptional regulator [Burkholderiales bacterium]
MLSWAARDAGADAGPETHVSMLPDLQSLLLFVRAAEMRSITRASEACGIAVAAGSRRIGLLEHHFGVRLFERSSRGVELTRAGEVLLDQARQLIERAHATESIMTAYTEGRDNVLRVYANTSAMTQFLPDDLAAFAATERRFRLIIEERWSTEVVAAVRAGEADLGVVVGAAPAPGLHYAPDRADRLAAVVPAGHPIGDEPVAFEQVLAFDLVGLESGSSMMRLVFAQASERLKPLRIRVQVKSFEAVCRMVRAGLGIGILPEQAARYMAASLGLRTVPISDAWASRTMQLCYRAGAERTPGLTELLAHLQERAAGAAQPGREDSVPLAAPVRARGRTPAGPRAGRASGARRRD